jgi:hypothetical protein
MSAVDDNLRAINDFFHRPENAPKTAAAKKVFNQWVEWWEANKDNWFNGQAEFDHARNLRNDYNRANATTPSEKAAVEQVIRTGVSIEQAQGETDRRNASGDLVEAPPDTTKKWWFWPGVAAGGTAVAIVVVPKAIKLWLGVR